MKENNIWQTVYEQLQEKLRQSWLDLHLVKYLLDNQWVWDFLMNTTELWHIGDILDILKKQISWLRFPTKSE
jgi:hypothetical protein